jgi:protein-disulfide isomerase
MTLTRGLLTAVMTALLIAPQLGAAPIQYPELESFSRKALTLCPGETRIVIDPVDQAGPANFKAYRVSMTSSVYEECREVAFALVSQKTSNVLFAAVFVLQDDSRTAAEKIKERAEVSLKKPYEVSVSPTANPDGLKTVTLTNRTSDGPIVTTGYLDASERFFMVGRLLDMKKDPRTQYLEMLGAIGGAKRGSTMSRVQVLEISDFQCPSCQYAHNEFETFLKKHGDKIGYTRIDLPFFESHDWTLRASLAARALQKLRPDVYWPFVDFIFRQQGDLRAATIDKVIDGFLEDNEVDVLKVRQLTNDSKEKRAMIEQVGRLYSSEIYATPTILVNGQKVFWNRESRFLFDHIESLLKQQSPAPARK